MLRSKQDVVLSNVLGLYHRSFDRFHCDPPTNSNQSRGLGREGEDWKGRGWP